MVASSVSFAFALVCLATNAESIERYEDVRPLYKFAHLIKDDESQVYHARQEERDGDEVRGVYQVVLPDGWLQTVRYSDVGNGLQADVIREPQTIFKNFRIVLVTDRRSDSDKLHGFRRESRRQF